MRKMLIGLSLFALSACGSNDGKQDTPASTPTAKPTAQPEPALKPFDLTGAKAFLAKKPVSSLGLFLADDKPATVTKIDKDGKEVPVGGQDARKIVGMKRSRKGDFLLLDSQGNSWFKLAGVDAVEKEVPATFETAQFNEHGDLYYVHSTDKRLYRIEHVPVTASLAESVDPYASREPKKVTEYPFDSMDLQKVSGKALKYAGTSNGTTSSFVTLEGKNFAFATCGFGMVTAFGDGLLYSDCSAENFVRKDGTKESLPVTMLGGGFWTPTGAVVQSSGQTGISCANDEHGIVHIASETKVITPIACTKDLSGIFLGKVVADGERFAVWTNNKVTAYDTAGMHHVVLEGFTPINLSLAGTTLVYDGMDADGKYVIGQVDIVTKDKAPYQVEGAATTVVAVPQL